jgi:hypothetical protein
MAVTNNWIQQWAGWPFDVTSLNRGSVCQWWEYTPGGPIPSLLKPTLYSAMVTRFINTFRPVVAARQPDITQIGTFYDGWSPPDHPFYANPPTGWDADDRLPVTKFVSCERNRTAVSRADRGRILAGSIRSSFVQGDYLTDAGMVAWQSALEEWYLPWTYLGYIFSASFPSYSQHDLIGVYDMRPRRRLGTMTRRNKTYQRVHPPTAAPTPW